MSTLTPLMALVDPVGGVPKAVGNRNWMIPLAFLALSTAGASTAIALKLDMTRVVIPKMEMSGELAKASEREISDQIQQAERVAIVGAVAKGVFLTPLMVLALAVLLKIASWLLGRKLLFSAAFTVAAIALLPIAVQNVLTVIAAFHQGVLTPTTAGALLPTSLAAFWPQASPKVLRALQAGDAFNLWAAALMGLGLAAGTGMKPWRGFLLGLVLYTMFAGVFLIGAPGLAEMNGGGGGPGMHGGPK